jgi:hypothetical protein
VRRCFCIVCSSTSTMRYYARIKDTCTYKEARNSPGHSKTIVKSGPLCSSQLVQRSRYVDDGENPLCATASSGTRRAIRAISRRSRVLRYLMALTASLLDGKFYNGLSWPIHQSGEFSSKSGSKAYLVGKHQSMPFSINGRRQLALDRRIVRALAVIAVSR